MTSFLPRQAFEAPKSIPKTYFLGHHHAGANKIKTLISNIGLVLECRDFRLPLSTHNPHLENTIAGCERFVVYTKSDLGKDSSTAQSTLRRLYGDKALFWDKHRPSTTGSLLRKIKDVAKMQDSLTGLRVMVVGMPNVGKSTIINALRSAGVQGKTAKAAKTGDQAGVTRKIGTSVRIVDSEAKGGIAGGVFVLDTPGIFQPYVEDGETMIKVALAHGIKKGLIPDEVLVDYLLYRLNLWDPSVYKQYCEPTNDVNDFLNAVAIHDGKLKLGGVPNWQEAAARTLSLWRDGKLGRFVLDELSEEDIQAHETVVRQPSLSVNQARKLLKASRQQSRKSD